MKANYQTHTERCRHAQGTEEDYIREALKAGVSILGFSDHAPFPDHDFGFRMPYDELETHLSALDRLAKLHASDIVIRKGLEIEYLPRYRDYYERLLTRDGLDYLLLGEHFYPDHGEAPFITSAQSTLDNIRYAEGIAAALKTGYFFAVAHPDLFTMNHFAWDRNCDAAVDIILNAAVSAGAILELNANGFRRGVHSYPDGDRYMYPHIKFWEAAAQTGLPVIIGSDCHEPCQVWDEQMDKAKAMLRALGIVPLEQMEDRIAHERRKKRSAL